ncbi:MAG: HD domain-containing phosphohydrolase [Thermodesulfovibrionales bacterium]
MNNNKEKILIIDDELIARYAVQQVLKDRYTIFTASGGKEGLDLISKNPVDLVVLDIKMPDMDGVSVLREIKKMCPDTEVILLTAYAGVETAQSALRLGALDYLTKPFDKDDVINVIERGLKKRQDSVRMKLEHENLLRTKELLEKEIEKARENLMLYYEGTIKALIRAIDAKDHYTFDHSEHVAKLSSEIADVMGFSKVMKDKLEHAAIMHDIGKIGINEQLLRKESLLTEEEHAEMRKHPEIGARIVRAVPFLEDTIDVILYHHERFDGSGYPEGLKGDKIPLSARIVSIADTIDAMMRDRPYRNALSRSQLIDELQKGAGTQFDPEIIRLVNDNKVKLF